ncbi:hypothetical protein [Capillimicrobium parvum]|uniref:Uncharacterized protein n=1 Tax=Capillimicrobium parvum TaxID=2884022 RepID=A0A9E6XX98_9ACTN|nr:hypothetical protein [Capillimicrobium parvum]UGS36101.1 hypothetical protein DSM104329_02499 [Capillimicrobium parvum]
MNAPREEFLLALEAVAYADATSPGDRLRALEMLERERQKTPDGHAVFDLSGLSGEALERELAGFLQPGYHGNPPPLPQEDPADEVAARVIEQVAEGEDTTMFSRTTAALARYFHGREDREDREQPSAEPGGKVVPLRPSQETAGDRSEPPVDPRMLDRNDPRVKEHVRKQQEAARAALAHQRREALPESLKALVPPGVDPKAADRQWPNGLDGRGRG